MCLPVAISGHDIVNLEFLADLLDAEMERVGFELFTGHVCDDGGGKAHQAGSLVLRGIAPSITLLAAASAICLGSCATVSIADEVMRLGVATLTGLGATTALQVAIRSVGKATVELRRLLLIFFDVRVAESALSKRDIVRSSDTLVASLPRHLDVSSALGSGLSVVLVMQSFARKVESQVGELGDVQEWTRCSLTPLALVGTYLGRHWLTPVPLLPGTACYVSTHSCTEYPGSFTRTHTSTTILEVLNTDDWTHYRNL